MYVAREFESSHSDQLNKKKSPGAVRLRGFSLAFLGKFFPFVFPLDLFLALAGEAFDELLHAVGALLLHLVGNMAIDIQGKDGGGVSQVFLHGLDIIPALDSGHGVAVPQVVEAGGRQADLVGQFFESLVDGIGAEGFPQLVCEYETGVSPGLANL